jgi:hypothetical protein
MPLAASSFSGRGGTLVIYFPLDDGAPGDEVYAAKFDEDGNVRSGWNYTTWIIERAKVFEAAYGKPTSNFRRSGA